MVDPPRIICYGRNGRKYSMVNKGDQSKLSGGVKDITFPLKNRGILCRFTRVKCTIEDSIQDITCTVNTDTRAQKIHKSHVKRQVWAVLIIGRIQISARIKKCFTINW
jgi:hypothetical protein